MTVTERIVEHLRDLPPSVQQRVLHFVELLEARINGDGKANELAEWSEMSLSNAMRGMEEEEEPYSLDDIREITP